jgi:hypothetical protein
MVFTNSMHDLALSVLHTVNSIIVPYKIVIATTIIGTKVTLRGT